MGNYHENLKKFDDFERKKNLGNPANKKNPLYRLKSPFGETPNLAKESSVTAFIERGFSQEGAAATS
jgi:hypothetical protein